MNNQTESTCKNCGMKIYSVSVRWFHSHNNYALCCDGQGRRAEPITQPAATPQPGQWIKFSERRPVEEDLPIEVFDAKAQFIYRSGMGAKVEMYPLKSDTHWRKANNEFPQPEKSESDLALEKLLDESHAPAHDKIQFAGGWKAAIAWKGAGK